jgi:hypothetical protein
MWNSETVDSLMLCGNLRMCGSLSQRKFGSLNTVVVWQPDVVWQPENVWQPEAETVWQP